MRLTLYTTDDGHDIMNKNKTLVDIYNINFKKQTNILSPTLYIHSNENLDSVNYAHIDSLDRFYHVTNIEPKPNNIYILHMEVDVIESYKYDIINAYKMIYDNKVKTEFDLTESNFVKQDYHYILLTLGSLESEG